MNIAPVLKRCLWLSCFLSFAGIGIPGLIVTKRLYRQRRAGQDLVGVGGKLARGVRRTAAWLWTLVLLGLLPVIPAAHYFTQLGALMASKTEKAPITKRRRFPFNKKAKAPDKGQEADPPDPEASASKHIEGAKEPTVASDDIESVAADAASPSVAPAVAPVRVLGPLEGLWSPSESEAEAAASNELRLRA